jgi:phospholipid/cholesterol/gamma-HCH transport system substrate-binding protein
MQRARLELAVGAFALLAFALLFWGTLRIGAIRGLAGVGAPTLAARFDDVSGLSAESDVLIAGVSIGKISAIELEGSGARVILRVEHPEVRIPIDSVAAIRARGMLGERVLEIVPGTSPEWLEDGGVITRTQEAADLDRLFARLTGVATDVEQIARSFRNALGGPEGEETVRDIVANVHGLTGQLRTIVEANSDRIDRIAMNLDEFSADARELSAGQKVAVAELVENLRVSSGKLRESLERLGSVTARLENGEGTLGKLLADDQVYAEVDGALGEARAAMREVRRAAEEAQEQVPAAVLLSIFGTLF